MDSDSIYGSIIVECTCKVQNALNGVLLELMKLYAVLMSEGTAGFFQENTG